VTGLADELGAALAAQPRVTVPLDRLAELLVTLRPELVTAPDRFGRLAEAVDELVARGVIEPSATRRRRQGVAVPAHVRVVGNRRPLPPDNPARRFPWVAEMAWAASGPRRPPAQQENLERLSRWIAANRGRPVVPTRERSLEVLGDDKLLDDLLTGVLSGHPATVEALAVEPVHPPMAVAPVRGASGNDVLVVENGTPFSSARRAAEHHAAAGRPVRYAWIGYGAGHQLGAIVPSLLALRPAAVDYFGDLDPNGLTIAAAAAARRPSIALPPLRPAHRLYELLLAHGRPQPAPRCPLTWPEAGLAWLGATAATQLHERLGDTHWLAQEWVGVEILTTDPGWCT
jgi:hypothetical protein